MPKFLQFLLKLRTELSPDGPLEKRVTVRYLRGSALHEASVEDRSGGTVRVVLRPHLVVRHPTPGSGGEGESTAVPLGAVLEIQIEEWDLEAPESVVTTRWVRDRRGRFRQVVQP